MNGSAAAGGRTISQSRVAGVMSIPGPSRAFGALEGAWKWLTRHSSGILSRSAARRLRVAETVSLGEKRFVSILHVDGEQFLVGASSSNIVLLAKLETNIGGLAAGSFESVLSRTSCSAEGVAPVGKGTIEVTR